MRIFLLGILMIFLGITFFFYPLKKDSKLQAKRIEKKEETCYFVAVNTLNLRENASKDSKILGKIKYNTKICSETTSNGFLKTNIGFLSLNHLSKNENAPQIQKIAKIPLPKEEKIALKQEKIKLISVAKQDNFLQKAEQFLAQKEYTKAKNLALLLNKENPKDARSWEIFAKSVYLEGKKEEAINILQAIVLKIPDDSLNLMLKAMQKGEKI